VKIACIGNMNNNLFNMTRYLRLEGYDVELFLLSDESAHFHPSNDCFGNEYEKYTTQLEWGNAFSLEKASKNEICESLSGFGFYIGCGSTPAYFMKAGLKLDLFVPYGSDLYDSPFFRLVHPKRLLQRKRFSAMQKLGIECTDNILLDSANELFEKPLKKLSYSGRRLSSGIPMIYAPEYNEINLAKHGSSIDAYTKTRDLSSKNKLVIFQHSRHVWKTTSDPVSIKRNDKLLKALSSLVHDLKVTDVHLVTLEYGEDVQYSKELVKELGVEEYVTWLPKMSRRDLMACISLVDVVAGEFNLSWLSYGVVYEAMVACKPILHYRHDELYKDDYPELYPMLNARSEKEITEQLVKAYNDIEALINIGVNARRWYDKYVVSNSISVICNLIESKKNEIQG
jgi:glycosyltransferase involved in cell wall biosynthesis